MKKKIIFNADDFGLSKGVNLGIIEAHQNGPVRSTTLMAGGVAFDHAVALAKMHPDLNVGIHLALTASKSVGGFRKTLTDENGVFLSLPVITEKAEKRLLDLGEVEAEYEAQIQKVLSSGIVPSHFDSHHHTHFLPGVFDVFIKMAEKYGISRVRMDYSWMRKEQANPVSKVGGVGKICTTDQFTDGFYGDGVTIDYLKRIIENLQENSLEIMLHPAYVDYTLYKSSSYLLPRMYELEILTGNELRTFLADENYEIASFSDLR